MAILYHAFQHEMPLETFSVDAPAAHTSVKNGGFWKMSCMKVRIADKAMQFKQTIDRLQKSPTYSLRVAPQRSVPMLLYCLAALGISHSSHSTRADLFVYVCVADAASARLPPPPPPLTDPHASSAASHSCTRNRRVWQTPLKHKTVHLYLMFQSLKARLI